MENNEPTFVPEWLKSSGGSSTSHQFTSSSLHADEQGVSKSTRYKSFDNNLGRFSASDRTTSSYFRRASISNGSAPLRSYSSFNRNHRDRDIYEFRNKEKLENRHQDYSDPLGNILPSRFEKDLLRRSHSSISGKHGESWPRKVASDVTVSNKSSHNNGSISNLKTSFERDFPSLGSDEKQADSDIGRVPSPGLSSAIQSLPIGSSYAIGWDGWTSALAEVPVIVCSNGNGTSVAQPVQPTSISATMGMTGGRNMAETLAHGPMPTQTAPQLAVGTQRLEELAVKQSRQLIPVTPSLPKALALNSCDKAKAKMGQSQLQSCHVLKHPHSPGSVSVKPETSKLLVLKPSRERNGISKESSSPSNTITIGSSSSSKLPNSPLAVVGPPPPPPLLSKTLEKRSPSSSLQAKSRNEFFNLVRKKSMTSSSTSSGQPLAASSEGGSSETKVDLTCNGNDGAFTNTTNNNNTGKKKNHDAIILYSEEEEDRFLRSLGWEENADEDEGLTQEEITSFYQNYLNMKPDLKGKISSNSKAEEDSS